MKVIVDDIEYDVPEPVGKKVQEANAYRLFLGGKSPVELYIWLKDLADRQDAIDKMQKESLVKLEDIKRKLGVS
jgi:hypothetical protein